MWKLKKTYIMIWRYAGVAQLVEHLIRNEGVVGSSPVTGTRKNAIKKPAFTGLFDVFLFRFLTHFGHNLFQSVL